MKRRSTAAIDRRAWNRLRSAVTSALNDGAGGRAELRDVASSFGAVGDDAGRIVAAAALLVVIGIADDDYAGFEDAVATVAQKPASIDGIDDPGLALLAQAGALIAGWFVALDTPELPARAATLAAALGDASIAAPLRCCAGLAALGYHHARMDLPSVLWLELALRPLLADPAVGERLADEGRHLVVQALYQCGATEQAALLRARHGAGTLPVMVLKRRLLDAQLALGAGAADAGAAALAAAEPLLDPRWPRLASWWHLLQSRLDLLQGRHRPALTHARLALRLGQDSRLPERWMGVTVMQEGQVQAAVGSYAEALPFFERAGRAASGTQAGFCHALAHLTRALQAFDAGAAESARAELGAGLALARELNWLHFFRATPAVAAAVCAHALEQGVEATFVREVIAARSLQAVRPGLAAWPWPIRVRTFGGLRIEIDGQPLAFKGKVARKPLELLLFVVASGGSDVAATAAAFALWRELDGDKARAALNAALHRLRRLLDDDAAVVIEHGRLSLDPQRVWVDSLAFEQLADTAAAGDAERAIALYGGAFLQDGDDEAWQLSCRARLASKFKRLLVRQVQAALQRGERGAARTLLERGLELDPLAEDLARELIQLCIDGGERAAALAVFERCRAAIGGALGVGPSPATLALIARIRSGPAAQG